MTAAAEAVLYRHRPFPVENPAKRRRPDPDRDLLAVCGELRRMQARWQKLWDACPEEGDGKSPADKALDRYTKEVWPATRPKHGGKDLPSLLIAMKAQTPRGRAAKAAAIVAMDDVYHYTPIEICGRDDELQMARSALIDCAGDARILVGREAP